MAAVTPLGEVRRAEAVSRERTARAKARQLVSLGDGDTPLGELLGVPEDIRDQLEFLAVSALCPSTRARTIVEREDYDDCPELLLSMSVRELCDVKGCSPARGAEIVTALLLALVQIADGENLPPRQLGIDDARLDQELAGYAGLESAGEILNAFLAARDGQFRAILMQRVLSDERRLADVATVADCSIETARRLHVQAREQLRALVKGTAVLADLAVKLRGSVNRVMLRQWLIEEFPQLAEPVAGTGYVVLNFVLAALELEERDGWVLRRSSMPRHVARTRQCAAGVRQDATDELAQVLSVSLTDLAQWLSFCGMTAIAGVLMPAQASQIVKAQILLGAHGAPMTFDELAHALAVDNQASFRSALSRSRDISLVGKGQFALSDWNIDVFSGISKELEKLIDADVAGRINLSRIAQELATKFNVAESSVQAAASSALFRRDGIWLSRSGTPRNVAVEGTATRRCYFRDDRWWLRIDIDERLIKSQSTQLTLRAAGLFHISHGEKRHFSCDGLKFAVCWNGRIPSISGLGFAERELGARPGDVLWISEPRGNSAGVRLCRRDGDDLESRIAVLTGIEAAEIGLLREKLAIALQCPPETGWMGMGALLANRGDKDVATLIDQLLARQDAAEARPTGLGAVLSALGVSPS